MGSKGADPMEAVDLSKIASCAQMSDHDDFKSDGD